MAVGGYVCDGNSLTAGFVVSGNPVVNPYPAQLAALTGKPVINLGQNGAFFTSFFSGWPHLDDDYAAHVAPSFNASTANVLIVEGGINDCFHGYTSAQIDTAVRSYCAKARATGFQVYLQTITPSAGLGSGETIRQAVNADRRAHWREYCDGLIDVDAASGMSNTSGSSYQSDGLHWTTVGAGIVAGLVRGGTGGVTGLSALLHPEKVGIDAWYWSYAAGTGPHGIDNWGGDSAIPNPADESSAWTPTETLLNGINAIGFRWYYTAEPHPLPANSGGSEAINPNPGAINWYPAVRSPSWQSSAQLARVAADPDLCIGYNEPWNTWAGSLTPTQALDAYAGLQGLPNRLATPSISFDSGFTLAWLADFMSGAVSRGYRVDVVNCHYYNSTADLAPFQAYLQGLHDSYGKPIIVTEWALADWSQPNGTTATWEQQAAFAVAGSKMLDGLSYVEAHAWFGITEGGGGRLNSGVINQDGSMTVVGQAFYNLLHPGQTSPGALAEIYKNGVLITTATLPNGLIYPAAYIANASDRGTANFGASPFSFLPAGAVAWDSGATPTMRSLSTAQTLGALGQTAGTATGGLAGITLNPADKFADIVLSNANLTATYITSRAPGNVSVRGNTAGAPDNYFEVIFSALVSGGVGVANLSQSLSAGYPGNPNAAAYYKDGYAEWPGSGYSNNFGAFAAGDVLGVFRRVTSVQFYKNGTLMGTATSLPTGDLYPIISPANNTDAATVNFGASAFSFAPSGALAWGTIGTSGPHSAQAAQTLPGIGQIIVASGGTGVVLTWDPAATGSGITLSNGNLTATVTSSSDSLVRATVGYSAGKHYAEVTLISANSDAVIGLEDSSTPLSTAPGGDVHGTGWYPFGWVGYNGNWVLQPTYTSGDILGIAYDASLKQAWFAKNGTWFGDPVAGTGYTDMSTPGLTGAAYITFGRLNGNSATINFGTSGFAFTPPTGFSSP